MTIRLTNKQGDKYAEQATEPQPNCPSDCYQVIPPTAKNGLQNQARDGLSGYLAMLSSSYCKKWWQGGNGGVLKKSGEKRSSQIIPYPVFSG
jgi:hypothetical protein